MFIVQYQYTINGRSVFNIWENQMGKSKQISLPVHHPRLRRFNGKRYRNSTQSPERCRGCKGCGMTPAQFKATRARLGLTQQQMADALGLKDASAVRHYEAGRRPVQGSVLRCLQYIEHYGIVNFSTPPAV